MALPESISGREKFFLILVSVMLSVLLWLQVTAQAEPNREREMLVRLVYRNLAQDLHVSLPDGVSVIVQGPEAQLERFEPADYEAVVDLRGLEQGAHNVLVQLPELRMPMRMRAKRLTVGVRLEKLARREFVIDVDTRGTTAPDLRYEGAVAQPQRVTITGPEDQIRKLTRIRAMLDLSTLRPGISQEVALEPLDAQNAPVTQVELSPSRVLLTANVAAAAATKTVPISPTWQGTPVFPWVVESYRLQPETVQITGSSDVLAEVYALETEPVPLGNVRANQTVNVQLRLPTGVRLVGQDEDSLSVAVEIRVRQGR